MNGPGNDEAFAFLIRGLDDPEALADLRSRYRGSTDLTDALRWRQDPAALGLSGLRSPTVRAEELKPIVYRRPNGPEEERHRDSVAAELDALLAGWAADSAALDTAIREHLLWRAGSAPVEPDPEPIARRRISRLRIGLFAGAGLVALGTLVAVGILLQPRTTEPVDVAAPSPTATPTSSATPTPRPTTTPPPQPAVTPTPPPEDTDLRPNYFEEDIYSVLQVPIDGGPIDNASGVATIDSYGVPLSYTVADGDVFELIAKRFDIGVGYLASINAVRRENPTELFVGDTINLGATTILLIGDQNGTVYDYTDRLPDPHMPQE